MNISKDDYLLTAYCPTCQAPLDISQIKEYDSGSAAGTKRLSRIVERVEGYLSNVKPSDPNLLKFQRGQTIRLFLSGLSLANHNGCGNKMTNIGFRLESKAYYSKRTLRELEKQNLFNFF